MPTWPASLPDLTGLAQSMGTGELHPETKDTEMDDGPDIPRRRKLYVETPLTMQVRLTPEQFVVFKNFHRDDLNTGTRWFTGPVLLPDMSIGTRTCRIKGKVGLAGNVRTRWIVSFTLLVKDW
ncbi:hypothetical protein [Methylobacterium brachythecii]|uniref:Uncharacterized protein n=1 Tax=Methylobacterium brachythecii TaxID=1176177 RepID=A0A7W6F869_9HYPH|nr:hypothetical protein [Methylobacterium brachythecii]MBB3904177.1 hypothetical protein [Methylobacterium brachythecii]GLS45161.1 hypothetical protein GCM10007884_31500 [Methylobacterium brachythecii]